MRDGGVGGAKGRVAHGGWRPDQSYDQPVVVSVRAPIGNAGAGNGAGGCHDGVYHIGAAAFAEVGDALDKRARLVGFGHGGGFDGGRGDFLPPVGSLRGAADVAVLRGGRGGGGDLPSVVSRRPLLRGKGEDSREDALGSDAGSVLRYTWASLPCCPGGCSADLETERSAAMHGIDTMRRAVGAGLLAFAGLGLVVLPAGAQATYVGQFGSGGPASGQFESPIGVAVGADGSVYVADSANSRVQDFTAAGVYQSQFGTHGTGNGQFVNPFGVAVGSNGSVYVADYNNNRVEYFDAAGAYQGQFGAFGSGAGKFNGPDGVAVAADGTVYVTDVFNTRVDYFSSTGASLGQFGSGSDQFFSPVGVAVGSGGNVYVTDQGNDSVEYFSSTGASLGQFGGTGSGAGKFSGPTFIAVASTGNVFVTDSGNNRVEYFSPTGAYLGQFGSRGSGAGQFNQPEGIAISGSTVYVADDGNNRVEYFNVTAAPEPSAWVSLGIGALGLCGLGWRARRRA